MIRDVGKKIKVNKYVEVEEVITKEKITEIQNILDMNTLNVTIVSSNPENKVVSERRVTISNENYELLFSQDSIFDVGKQVGTYRESDLWKVIDRITNGL